MHYDYYQRGILYHYYHYNALVCFLATGLQGT
jgi:hypothetical protein